MKIYIAGAISGMTPDFVITYFSETRAILEDLGYTVLSPMTGKDEFRPDIKYKSYGYVGVPIATNHAIVERDLWMVTQCDILYANLMNASYNVSIGSVMELAWGHILRKHTVLAMQNENIHQHAFVLEAADVIFENDLLAINYLSKLIGE